MHALIHVVSSKAKTGGLALAAAASIALTGCGGGTSTASSTTVTGQFVDAPVAGLSYKCGTSTTKGTTDANGYYTCNTGESVAFYVGDILLGSVASAQTVVTPLDLVGIGAKPTDTAVSNIVRFLLSISTTDGAGNLVIDANAGTLAAGKTVDFKTIGSAALDAMITTVKPGVTPRTQTDAENHMRDSIYKLFAKSYAGTYGGGSSGTWSLSISATNGSVTGTYADASNGAGVISGQMSTDMNVSSTYGFTGTAGSETWTGTLNVNTGVFSGTWSGGAFTGKAAATPAPAAPTGGTGGAITLKYATYSATPYSGGTQTDYTLKSITVEDSGLATKTNRVTVLGSGGGFEREIKIYVRDSDCVITNISHAWAGTAVGLSGPNAISSFVSNPSIGNALGLEPANNTVTLVDTLLDGAAPHVSTLKGTIKPSTKMCASAVVS